MSIATVGIVKGNFEGRVIEVLDRVSKAIEPIAHARYINWGLMKGTCWWATADFAIADIKDAQRHRSMKIAFGHYTDHTWQCPGPKLLITLGAWGTSVDVMRAVLKQFADEDTWLVPADNSDDAIHTPAKPPAVKGPPANSFQPC